MNSTVQVNETNLAYATKNRYKRLVEEMFGAAGIGIDGKNDWDIQVKNQSFYHRLIKDGTLGLGESYMDDWWECARIDTLFEKLAKANLQEKFNKRLKFIFYHLLAKAGYFSMKKKSFESAESHYDIRNDVFSATLDKRMLYSCGYWKNAKNVDQAQEDKLDLVCKKVRLKPGMRVLDIGCGWGAFAKFAAENYGVSVLGITISKEQVKYAKEVCAGLPVEIRLQDYRDLNGKFDTVVSVGMFEHVCSPNYPTYFKIVNQCLKDDGLFLLHTIGRNKEPKFNDFPWIRKYIFPISEVPTIKQIAEAAEEFFVMEDWHNFGTDYDKTLMAWHQNFINNWPKIKNNYGDRFFRLWEFYLLMLAGVYRARATQLWQVVYSKGGLPGGYQKFINYNFD